MMYEPLPPGLSLSQGDVIDNCPIFSPGDPSATDGIGSEPTRYQVRAVVLTQSCDLAQSKTSKVVVAVVHSCADLVTHGVLKPATIRDNVRRHQVYGWYFLPTAPEPIRLPESIVDLRSLHTVPRAVLEHLIAAGEGVCRLATPYREHLAQHFGVTYMRIGLPEPYATES
jgi:hypothetical protein